ncbi:hypothetical protein HI914_03942 [Erysiphe necator]|nr:hypothetical protein HI914_03942 [Erysiphe necator]
MAEDISPLEYARINLLSRDYKADRSGLKELEYLCIQERKNEDFSQDSHLPDFDFGQELKVEERLQLSKSAALLIQSIKRMNVLEPGVDQNFFSISEEIRVSKSLRLELPLLRSDHKTDCKNFGRRDDFEIRIQDIKLPLEIIDELGNSSLTFNPKLWNLSSNLIEKLECEKLCVSKNTLSFLHDTLKKDLLTVEDKESIWNGQQKYLKIRDRSIMTPPLSPLEFSPQLYQPSSSDSLYQVSLLSDSISPTKQEIKKLESEIFYQDVPTPIRNLTSQLSHFESRQNSFENNDIKLGSIYSPLKYLDDSSCYVEEVPRVKRESLKVDETLTPIDCNTVVYPDPGEFSNILKELEGGSDVKIYQDTSDLEQELFKEKFLPAYESVTQEVEQEELLEADVMCRVTVPNMDFSKEEPPWIIFANAANNPSKLLTLQKTFMKECIGSSHVMQVRSTNSDHHLRWNPFPNNLTSKIYEQESLDIDEINMGYFFQIENCTRVMDSSSAIWKPPGLRILREYEDSDEEVEPYLALTEIPKSITEVAKKRKMRIEDNNSQISNNSENLKQSGQSSCTLIKPFDLGSYNQCKDSEKSSLLGGSFSACNALENFLEIRGAKKLKLTKSPHFNKSNSKPLEFMDRDCSESNLIVSLPQPCRATIPVINEYLDEPISVVVTSKLFRNRVLMRTVEKLLPKLNLIERDFNIHNTVGWMRGSVTRSPIISPLANEADIIISPITGVILTTLQKVRQKPLPGQKVQSSIRAILASVSSRYENLIVLVSEDRADECTVGPNTRDCLALCEFIGFTISLESLVIVRFIGGGEETLAHWLVNFILRYSVRVPTPVQDETLWEIFLRRAGFNTFAAQAVIAQLMKPLQSEDSAKKNVEHFGLISFVRMSASQRMHQLGHLVGKYILERVSRKIDSTWTKL